jgi:hypothetical protein
MSFPAWFCIFDAECASTSDVTDDCTSRICSQKCNMEKQQRLAYRLDLKASLFCTASSLVGSLRSNGCLSHDRSIGEASLDRRRDIMNHQVYQLLRCGRLSVDIISFFYDFESNQMNLNVCLAFRDTDGKLMESRLISLPCLVRSNGI